MSEFERQTQPNDLLDFVRRLMPKASEEELRRATENWDGYMRAVYGIIERFQSEGRLEELEALIESEERRRKGDPEEIDGCLS